MHSQVSLAQKSVKTIHVNIIPGIRHLSAPIPASVVTIGNFDGVHLGHRALISRLVTVARTEKIPSVLLTFEPHPVKVLHPGRDLKRIFEINDLKHQLKLLNLDLLVIEPFSREFSQLPPEKFVLDCLFKPFSPELVVVGYDFSFGAHRQGSIDVLKDQGKSLGFKVEVVPPVKVGEHLASSSRIRQAIEVGDVVLACALLGRRFYLRGLVEKGAGRGRTIGFPTANLRLSAELIPARGVYAAIALVRGKQCPAAVNIGFNPTFNENENSTGQRTFQKLNVEAHLIDYLECTGEQTEFYGETVTIEFVKKLREEIKFSSVVDLKNQIAHDVAQVKMVISEAGE